MITIETTLGGIFMQIPNKPRKTFVVARFIMAILLSLTSPASAAITQFWAGPGGTTNAPTSGTWTNGSGTVWSDGASTGGNSTWTNGNSAMFAGADGAY